MMKFLTDIKLVIGFIFAHFLLYLTFSDKNVFWYIFTASMLFLITYTILNESVDDEVSTNTYLSIGVISGLILFGLFWAGNFLIDILNLPFSTQISKLYNRLSPTAIWHYIVLLLIIIPGEEIFWRGFIQKRLFKHVNVWPSIIISAVMYSLAHLYSGSYMLVFAALFAGLFWGWLYAWKRSIPLVIVSHLIFDLFLLVIFPLY
ncbi:CPBP family intramembrane glutamic endopeptidase [Bacillus sp. 31A1R]|uniref:CPBP family intramembrane glutamic endopeptidase n=1 Tax=Robertmurraya mangrovi TaxID=3098077 RepID=A0ABU5ITT1_9BACI|nr:CPBP family intramembrane glutamic endopeptidase [Bacillus sp. 31A1R]MDZ5470559.1 CPBP family intramembrane glutamic endopeptidase [Bacillus sp. 31A1R]